MRDLIVIQAAQLKYLTEEQSALLVAGQFNDATSRIYRTLQRHTSAFSDSESLDLLRSAVTLASAAAPLEPRGGRFQGGNQGGYYGNRGGFRGNRGGFRGRGGFHRRGGFDQPNYSNWNNQQGDNNFPTRRPAPLLHKRGDHKFLHSCSTQLTDYVLCYMFNQHSTLCFVLQVVIISTISFNACMYM